MFVRKRPVGVLTRYIIYIHPHGFSKLLSAGSYRTIMCMVGLWSRLVSFDVRKTDHWEENLFDNQMSDWDIYKENLVNHSSKLVNHKEVPIP